MYTIVTVIIQSWIHEFVCYAIYENEKRNPLRRKFNKKRLKEKEKKNFVLSVS